MKTSYKVFLASAATLPLLGVAGAVAQAQTAQSDGAQNLIQKIATKFNLKESDVKAVFDEAHTAREAEMRAKVSEALKTAGFSDAQISSLEAKQKEQREAMKAWRDANPNATRDQIKAQHDQQRTAFETWAKEQGIDLTKLKDALKSSGLGMMGGMGRGHGRMGGMGQPNDTPAN